MNLARDFAKRSRYVENVPYGLNVLLRENKKGGGLLPTPKGFKGFFT